MAQYSILVEDEGYDAQEKVIFNSTRITVRILVIKSQEALTDEQEQAMDQETAQKQVNWPKTRPLKRRWEYRSIPARFLTRRTPPECRWTMITNTISI